MELFQKEINKATVYTTGRMVAVIKGVGKMVIDMALASFKRPMAPSLKEVG